MTSACDVTFALHEGVAHEAQVPLDFSGRAVSAEEQHRFASLPHKYFHQPGNKRIRWESKNKQGCDGEWWMLRTIPWKYVQRGVSSGSSSATLQLDVFSQKMLYDCFLDTQP